MTRLGVVTGLTSEAACLDPTRSTFDNTPALMVASAFGPLAAERAARELIEEGALGLASFGTAGGLDPALGAGAVILPDAVLDSGGARYATDPVWREALRGRVGSGVAGGPLLGVDEAVAGVQAKARLGTRSGAQAVDMESHAVAHVAKDCHVPFLVARVISDPARHRIPWAAMRAFGPDGQIRPVAGLVGLLMRPWELPAVVRIARDELAALRSLRRVAAAAPLLGFGLRESLLDV